MKKLSVMLFLLLVLFPPFLLAQNLQVHFINVGQGDSILIISPENKAVLIDAGDKPFGNTVTEYLTENHIKNLDIVVETHQDSDHIGGMAKVVEKFPISLYLVSVFEKNTQTSKKLDELINQKEIQVKKAKSGQHYELDGADIEILFPSGPPLPKPKQGTQSNVNSIVAKLTYEDVSFLLLGDVESETEEKLLKEQEKEKLKADILKIAHHGSKYATTQEFLETVNPKIAVISVGPNNYGHPSNSTIERLKDKGVAIYRTDDNGNIVIETNGKTYEVRTQKKQEVAASEKPRAPPLALLTIDEASAQENSRTDSGYYVGSKNSDKVHLPSCVWAQKIKPENLITFSALNEAYKKGYQSCKVCKPDAKISPRSQTTSSSSDEIVYVTRTGGKYHRGYCSYLRKSKIPMKKQDAINAGYGSCSRCNP